jgi:thiamine biosynthesis lipoprotein
MSQKTMTTTITTVMMMTTTVITTMTTITNVMMTSVPIAKFNRSCMGTFFTYQIQGEVSASESERMVDSATEILTWADETFSVYKTESETSRLRTGSLDWKNASAEQLEVSRQCQHWWDVTAGFFDAREGAEYDPSGLVKVWAAARAADFLEANGVRDFTLNAGGDVYLSSNLTPGHLSKVGLSAPRSIKSKDAGANFVLELAATEFHAVATSGSAERGEHIWGRAEEERFLQVSVIAKDFLEADIWATALVSGGMAAWEHFMDSTPRDEFVALATKRDGSVISSPGFTNLLVAL